MWAVYVDGKAKKTKWAFHKDVDMPLSLVQWHAPCALCATAVFHCGTRHALSRATAVCSRWHATMRSLRCGCVLLARRQVWLLRSLWIAPVSFVQWHATLRACRALWLCSLTKYFWVYPRNLVDPASCHMLVSRTKPCKCESTRGNSRGLCTAH